MIVLGVMLPQQVLAVIVAVWCAPPVEVMTRMLVIRVDDPRLVVKFDEHDWTVDAVVEGAVIIVRTNQRKVRVAQVIKHFVKSKLRMTGPYPMQVNIHQISQYVLLLGVEIVIADTFVGQAHVIAVRGRQAFAWQSRADGGLGLLFGAEPPHHCETDAFSPETRACRNTSLIPQIPARSP